MSEWWTYSLQDLVLYSEQVYRRLFELHNAAVWPAQILALVLGAVCFALILRPRPWSDRFIAVVVAGAWIFVAWGFLWLRYAPINWAMGYAAPVFVLEALLLLGFGALRNTLVFRVERGSLPGLALFAYGLGLHPFVAVVAGRPLQAAEIFGIAPDPTAIGTLGLLVLAKRGWATWLLAVVPGLWCVVSWATLQTMGTWEAWIPLAALGVAVVARFGRPR